MSTAHRCPSLVVRRWRAAVGALACGTVLVGARPAPCTARAIAAPVLASAAASANGAFVVVVHVANPATSLTREQVARLFLRKIRRWPSGAIAEPVDLPPNTAVREQFTREVLGKSVGTVRAYWQQRLFSGAEVPPPEKASEADALEFVREHPAALTYVSTSTSLPEGVRALAVTE